MEVEAGECGIYYTLDVGIFKSRSKAVIAEYKLFELAMYNIKPLWDPWTLFEIR